MSNIKIHNVRTILTAPAGINLVIVKIETTEPDIYGLGCATFTQRYLAVKTAVDDFLKPFLEGKDPLRIEDIWHTSMVSSYWRNGPVLNNAVSGVDEALWDIKGKLAGMPVYQLMGGKCREAANVYCHVNGRDKIEVEEGVSAQIEKGYRYIRCQMGGYGGTGHKICRPENFLPGEYYNPDAYCRSIPELFDYLRSKLGFEIEFLHDIHERLVPIEAVRLAKNLEQYRLFFLEDIFAPEQLEWFKIARQQCAVPLAMGELFSNPVEWTELISKRLIDFIRVHVSTIGGLTPARKLATFCEAFGIRTAWHGPGDVSPVGHAANLHLDLCCRNFGIQEVSVKRVMDERLQEVFPGCPQIRKGYLYGNDKPGLGIDIDEKKAAKYPCRNNPIGWTLTRFPDGTSVCP